MQACWAEGNSLKKTIKKNIKNLTVQNLLTGSVSLSKKTGYFQPAAWAKLETSDRDLCHGLVKHASTHSWFLCSIGLIRSDVSAPSALSAFGLRSVNQPLTQSEREGVRNWKSPYFICNFHFKILKGYLLVYPANKRAKIRPTQRNPASEGCRH